jgi:hypothetical protein
MVGFFGPSFGFFQAPPMHLGGSQSRGKACDDLAFQRRDRCRLVLHNVCRITRPGSVAHGVGVADPRRDSR